MTDRLTLRILTPVGTAFIGSVDAVFLPGSAGAIAVLPGHAPISSSLESGRILWRQDGTESVLAVRGGGLILEDNTLTVCAQEG